MPIKLIFVIILAVLVALFTGFNLDNKTDFWMFYNFKDVSVLLLVFCSFLLGVFVTLPFTFGKGKKRKTDKSEKKADKKLVSDEASVTVEKKTDSNKKLFGKKSKSKKSEVAVQDDVVSGTPTSTDEDYSE